VENTNLIKQWLTDKNNLYDIGIALWVLGGVGFLVLAFWNHDKFDPVTFGTGYGLYLAGGGGMSWLRKDV
jgi:hypothetical protein